MAAPPDVIAAEQGSTIAEQPAQTTGPRLPSLQQTPSIGANSSPRQPLSNAASPHLHPATTTPIALRVQPANPDAPRSQANNDPSISPDAKDASQDAATQDDDPFAAMRRQRAEEELQRQVSAQDDKRLRDRQIGSARINKVPPPTRSPGDPDRANPNSIAPELAANDWIPVSPWAHCPSIDLQSADDDPINVDALDCFLDAGAHDAMNPFARQAMMTYLGFGVPSNTALQPAADFCHSLQGCDQ